MVVGCMCVTMSYVDVCGMWLLGRHLSSCRHFQFPFPELCLLHPQLARVPFPWGWAAHGEEAEVKGRWVPGYSPVCFLQAPWDRASLWGGQSLLSDRSLKDQSSRPQTPRPER